MTKKRKAMIVAILFFLIPIFSWVLYSFSLKSTLNKGYAFQTKTTKYYSVCENYYSRFIPRKHGHYQTEDFTTCRKSVQTLEKTKSLLVADAVTVSFIFALASSLLCIIVNNKTIKRLNTKI